MQKKSFELVKLNFIRNVHSFAKMKIYGKLIKNLTSCVRSSRKNTQKIT